MDGIIQEVFRGYGFICEYDKRVVDKLQQELIEKIKQEFTYKQPPIGYNVIAVSKVLQKLIGDTE